MTDLMWTPRGRLLVEGSNDAHALAQLLQKHGIKLQTNWRPAAICDCGSDAELLNAIPSNAKSYERLGVVVDADLSTEVKARWRQLRDITAPLGLHLPEAPYKDGVVVDGMLQGGRFGVWIMPDNGAVGAIEAFLSHLISPSDPVWRWAIEATENARTRGAPFRHPAHEQKARIHTWLAWQDEPGQPFGRAISKRMFDVDAELAVRFIAWIRRLFFDVESDRVP